MNQFKSSLLARFPWGLAATLVGGLTFVWAQIIFADWGNVADWIGNEIVKQGGYAEYSAGAVGWTVHLSIAFSYAMLTLAVSSLPTLPKRTDFRVATYLTLAVLLGWITTLITSPAIAVTISVLSGNGFPEELPGLNYTFGLAFWNHLAFFGITFLLIGIIPDSLFNVRDGHSDRVSVKSPPKVNHAHGAYGFSGNVKTI